MPNYDPRDWYWKSDDGRLYGSKAQKILDLDDDDFAAWQAIGGVPTVWPRDEEGNQTNTSLQDVLTPYGLSVDGKPIIPPMSFLQFLGLFTTDEQLAIAGSNEPQVRLFCLMAVGADGVDVADQRTITGTQQLETLKLIAKGRAAQVLAAKPPPAAQTGE